MGDNKNKDIEEMKDKMKKTNDSYKKDKKAYEKLLNLKAVIKKDKIELKQMQRKKEDAEKSRDRAIEDKDKNAQKNAEAAMKLADEEIKRIKGNIAQSQLLLNNGKGKVDSYINELSQDPELKNQINYILKQRYTRAAKKEEKKKEQVDKLIEIFDKHPGVSNYFKGMIKAEEELKKIDAELKTLDPKSDAKRINEIQTMEIPTMSSKKSVNEKNFKEYCEKNNIEFDEKLLKELITEKSYKHDKEGNIKLDKTLKNISKSYAKNVKAYELAINEIPAISSVANKEKNGKKENTEKENEKKEGKTGLPARKFKWYEFGKKFNAWKERTKVKKEQKANEQEVAKIENPSEKFRDAYKYDVIQDYVKQKEQEILREAQRTVRRQNDENER